MTFVEQRMVFVAKWRPFVMSGLCIQESDKPTLEFDADLDTLQEALARRVAWLEEGIALLSPLESSDQFEQEEYREWLAAEPPCEKE